LEADEGKVVPLFGHISRDFFLLFALGQEDIELILGTLQLPGRTCV
jgi:hypothetical protein